MSHAHLDVPAAHIPPGQIMDHTRNSTRTASIKNPRKRMKTVIEPFKTRNIANPGRTLTKNTTNWDTLWDRRMNNLLTHTNRQIKLSTAYSKYSYTKASSSSSNQHTQTWIANQLYHSTPSSQPERRTSTHTHSNAIDQLRIMASKKNTAKNRTTTSRHSTSVVKASSKMKSIRKTTTHTIDPMTINKSNIMTTSMLTMLKSVLQHVANVTAAFFSRMPYTGTFEKHAWRQNWQKQNNQSHLE